MIRIVPLTGFVVAGLASAPGDAQPAVRAQAAQSWSTFLSHRDYPADAIRNYEQGTVVYRLEINPEGRPTDCLVTESSASLSLDAVTCRLLLERARFRPARNAQGKAVSDTYSGRIVWRLPIKEARAAFAFHLWRGCVLGEASKYILDDLPAPEIARRAYPLCAGLETLFAGESGQTAPLTEPRERLVALVDDLLLEGRKVFNPRPADQAGQQK